MRVLVFDIETAPKKAYVWQFWKQNIGLNQLIGYGYVMSIAYKWLGEDEIFYLENRTEDDRELVEKFSHVLESADMAIAHNCLGFDIPVLRSRAVIHGIAPWSPVKIIDTLRIAKREFRFDSNKLEYIAKVLGVEEKDQHKEFPGFELWAECMAGNPKAWKEMRLYNVQDVITLEQVYLKLRPWATNHPNVMVNKDSEEHACPKCGGTHLHRRGYQYTNTGKYQRYQCTDCGGWSRTRYTENTKEVRKSLLTNAV